MVHTQTVTAGGRKSILPTPTISPRVTVTGGVRELGGGPAGTLSRTSAAGGQVYASVQERKTQEAFRAGEVESGVIRGTPAQRMGIAPAAQQPYLPQQSLPAGYVDIGSAGPMSPPPKTYADPSSTGSSMEGYKETGLPFGLSPMVVVLAIVAVGVLLLLRR